MEQIEVIVKFEIFGLLFSIWNFIRQKMISFSERHFYRQQFQVVMTKFVILMRLYQSRSLFDTRDISIRLYLSYFPPYLKCTYTFYRTLFSSRMYFSLLRHEFIFFHRHKCSENFFLKTIVFFAEFPHIASLISSCFPIHT